MRRIAAKYVYTLDSFDPIVDGFVETEDDGTVIRTGKCDDLLSEPYFWDGVIMPGFVNAHCHVELSHLRGKFLKGSGMAGFIDQINALRDSSSREDKIKSLSLEMEKVLQRGPEGDVEGMPKSQRVLELNAQHPVFEKLSAAQQDGDSEKVALYAGLLYDQALLVEGILPEDPVAFAQRVCELM